MKLQDIQKLYSLLNEFVEHSSEILKRAKCGSSFSRKCLAHRLIDTIIISKRCMNEVQWEMQRIQFFVNNEGGVK